MAEPTNGDLLEAFITHSREDAGNFGELGRKLDDVQRGVNTIERKLTGDGTYGGRGVIGRLDVLESQVIGFHNKTFVLATILLPAILAAFVYMFNRLYENSQSLERLNTPGHQLEGKP